jgi:hypothetical protein
VLDSVLCWFSCPWIGLLSPVTYKCLLKVLWPIRRPETTLCCILLKDNNRAFVARLGPEINSRACLCVLQGPRYNTKCRFPAPKDGSGPACRRFHLLVPQHGQGPSIDSPVLRQVQISFNAVWRCRANGDVVGA